MVARVDLLTSLVPLAFTGPSSCTGLLVLADAGPTPRTATAMADTATRTQSLRMRGSLEDVGRVDRSVGSSRWQYGGIGPEGLPSTVIVPISRRDQSVRPHVDSFGRRIGGWPGGRGPGCGVGVRPAL